jgi:hypothetical protein
MKRPIAVGEDCEVFGSKFLGGLSVHPRVPKLPAWIFAVAVADNLFVNIALALC